MKPFAPLMRTFALMAIFTGISVGTSDAGNVTVQYSGGVLKITGDQDDNRIEIHHLGNDTFQVVAMNANTTLNRGKRPITIGKVLSIVAKMDKGNDDVYCFDDVNSTWTILQDSLTIDMGPGTDDVQIYQWWVNGDVSIGTDGSKDIGNDFLLMEDLLVNGFLKVTMGGGDDVLLATPNTNSSGVITALAGAHIDTGSRHRSKDFVYMDHLFTWGGIDLLTSQGPDKLELETLLVYEGNLNIDTAGGEDELTLQYGEGWNMNWQLTDFDTSVLIDVGHGNNLCTVEGLHIKGYLLIDSGVNHDQIAIKDVQANMKLGVATSSGDDLLVVTGCTAPVANLDGGYHKFGDMLQDVGNSFWEANFTNWEF